MRKFFKPRKGAFLKIALALSIIHLWVPALSGQELEFGNLLNLPEGQSDMEVFGYTSPNVAEVTGCWASFYVESSFSEGADETYTTSLLLTSSQGLPSLIYERDGKSLDFVGIQVGPSAYLSFYSDTQGLDEEYRTEAGELIDDLEGTYYWDDSKLVVMECLAK